MPSPATLYPGARRRFQRVSGIRSFHCPRINSPWTRSIEQRAPRQARGRLERAARTNAEEPGETPPGVHRARRERVAVQAKRQADAAAPDRAQPRGADATETVGAQRIKQGVLEVARVGEGVQL